MMMMMMMVHYCNIQDLSYRREYEELRGSSRPLVHSQLYLSQCKLPKLTLRFLRVSNRR